MRLLPSSLFLLLASQPSFGQAHWEVLVDLPQTVVTPLAVSDDGETIGGLINGFRAFRWTAVEGVVQLAPPTGAFSAAFIDMSRDGGEIVGNASVSNVQSIVRWSGSAAPNVLPTLPQSAFPVATAMSADGSTVVGNISSMQPGEVRAVRWVDISVVEDLGSLGSDKAWAVDVSDDGAVIVGAAEDAVGRIVPFRWTAALGMLELGSTATVSSAVRTRGYGTAAFGYTLIPGRDEVLRWGSGTSPTVIGTGLTDSSEPVVIATSTDGTAALWLDYDSPSSLITSFYWSSTTGVLSPGSGVRLVALSADGTIASGFTTGPGPSEAVRWSPTLGLEVLASGSLDDASGSAMTPDGTTVVGISRNQDVTRWRSSREIGLPYCGPAAANSSGQPAALIATGTNALQAGQLDLVASSLPSSSFGFFLASRVAVPATPVVQSQGLICLGGAVGRFVGPGQILNSGGLGEIELAVPIGAIATPTGLVSAQYGESWYFQAWFRDANPTPTSNFTNGVRVTFL